MDMDLIIAQLQERGYNAIAHDVVKNSVTRHGISIRESNISPVIYVDSLIQANPSIELDDLVNQIINIYESNKSVDFDVDLLTSREFILQNIYIGLQRSSSEELTKRDCDDFAGIEQYLYVRGKSEQHGSWNMKIHAGILKKADISEKEAWAVAETNTFSNTVIQSMASIMNEMLGFDDEDEIADDDSFPMYVISNRDKHLGAVQVLDKKAITEFARKHNASKLIILPSSLHEMILVIPTDNEELDLSQFENMVAEVNATQVAPEERLTNKAYILHLEVA